MGSRILAVIVVIRMLELRNVISVFLRETGAGSIMPARIG